MAIVKHYTDERRQHQAARLGRIFELPDAGMKITEGGWTIEGWGDRAMLKVELVAVISLEEVNALINSEPLDTKEDT